jgi:3-hydroxy-9,10-secoandrosta-1,3,5(10)-triene-9,17-dione monooxygenase
MKVDHDEVMRRVAQLSPVLAANARACDLARQVVPESMRALITAGMFRISQPARVGGFELTLRSLAGAVTGLSEACPSSGWVVMVMGAHHWCLGSFPEGAQDEVLLPEPCPGREPLREQRADIASTAAGNSRAALITRNG